MDKLDEELVKEVQEGSIRAFEDLVRRWQNRLLSFTYRFLGDEQEAQDVVQDALFNLYKTIDRVDTTKKFSSYVYVVVRNTTMSYMRKRKPEVSLADIDVAQESLSFEEKLIAESARTSIKTALATLEPKYREIIRLYYFDQLSYEEVSRKLKLPINTVRTHLRRAKEKLQKTYETH
ncbi:sigma-70 family RNA polymerase sigma factor [Candidatus Gottesmanbacteria bacterium]|nr:sigma-70 family RNA polymerase sigma factor [Candidatus Gottesmanbacteria bacterium]